MKLCGFSTALLPIAAAVSSCADVDGKDLYLRAPWYARNFEVYRPSKKTFGDWYTEQMDVGTDTMQVGQPERERWIHNKEKGYKTVLMMVVYDSLSA